MSNSRHFLKQPVLFGAAATTPISFALGHNESPYIPAMQHSDEAFAVGYPMGRPATPPRKITIPDVSEYKVLKGGFHMHMLWSDGSVMPKDRVRE
ncbi:MAG: hypothetical protein FWD31_13660 [Planctomycetaceae bacterium]|nr:hypothetical protein [Planctomycetaceae bacterium]